MNIDEVLDMIDETVDESTNVPFSGGKRLVDVERIHELLDEVRLNLPAEIRQAKAIVNDRTDIISTAKKEAESIIKRAEDRARVLVSQEEVVKAAQQRANDVATAAQNQSREMRSKTTEYCEDLLKKTEEQLIRSASEVKTVRSTLRQQGTKTVRAVPHRQNP